MPNQNVPNELATAQVMAAGTDSLYTPDGLAASGVSMADMNQGFTRETLPEEGRVDPDGTNYVGDTYSRPGFNGPASKYQRL